MNLDLKINQIERPRFSDLTNFKPGQCYQLIKELVDKDLIKLNENIAYVYCSTENGETMRHCCLIDDNYNIIDPLCFDAYAPQLMQNEKFLTYYPIKTLSVNEYKKCFEINMNTELGLRDYLRTEETKLIKSSLIPKNVKIQTVDFFDYVYEILAEEQLLSNEIINSLESDLMRYKLTGEVVCFPLYNITK